MNKSKSLSRNHKAGFLCGLASLFLAIFVSCSGNKPIEEKRFVDDDAFYATQPFHSGLYDAETYDITGKNDRKGKFDGRVYFSLNPERSVIYVYENGNRTKISYIVDIPASFEKTDSGTYVTKDNKGLPVMITPDTTLYNLKFQHSGQDVAIGFSPKPRSTGSSLETIERITDQIEKNKSRK